MAGRPSRHSKRTPFPAALVYLGLGGALLWWHVGKTEAPVGGVDAAESRARQPGRPPTCFLIVVDTMRFRSFGMLRLLQGHAARPSTHLAAEGIMFRHAVAQASWTRPFHRATILTRVVPVEPSGHQQGQHLADEVFTLGRSVPSKRVLTTAGLPTTSTSQPHVRVRAGLLRGRYRYIARLILRRLRNRHPN